MKGRNLRSVLTSQTESMPCLSSREKCIVTSQITLSTQHVGCDDVRHRSRSTEQNAFGSARFIEFSAESVLPSATRIRVAPARSSGSASRLR